MSREVHRVTQSDFSVLLIDKLNYASHGREAKVEDIGDDMFMKAELPRLGCLNISTRHTYSS